MLTLAATTPNWADIGQLGAAVVGLLVVAGGAKIAIDQLSTSKRVAEADLLFQLARYWDDELSEAKISSRQFGTASVMASKLNSLEDYAPERQLLLRVPSFMELLGVHQKNGSLTLTAIDRLWGGTVVWRWKMYEQWIRQQRNTDTDDSKLFEWFEDLYNKLSRERERRSTKCWLVLGPFHKNIVALPVQIPPQITQPTPNSVALRDSSTLAGRTYRAEAAIGFGLGLAVAVTLILIGRRA
jgi:Domain of unknown function (DUF4760)